MTHGDHREITKPLARTPILPLRTRFEGGLRSFEDLSGGVRTLVLAQVSPSKGSRWIHGNVTVARKRPFSNRYWISALRSFT